VLKTIISVVATTLLTLGLLVFYLRRTLPDIQTILNDVGASVSGQLKEAFLDPNVKKAFSILGKQSGEVRANDALREKAADKLLEGYPAIGMILDQLDLTPIEGLQLMNDPLVGPMIRGALQKGLEGLQGGGGSAPHNSQFRSEF
jgi:hypothetical protein